MCECDTGYTGMYCEYECGTTTFTETFGQAKGYVFVDGNINVILAGAVRSVARGAGLRSSDGGLKRTHRLEGRTHTQ